YVGRDRRGRLIDANREQSARELLAGLKRLAEATQAAVLVVRHLTKAARALALHRGTRSIGITRGARSVIPPGRDPEDPDQRALAMVKGNLGPRPRTLRYRLETTNRVAGVKWGEACDLRADDLLRREAASVQTDQHGPVEEFLWRLLQMGPKPA